jgi:hypothetical protein
MPTVSERVWDADHRRLFTVEEDADGCLTITADEGGDGPAVSVALDLDGVIKLRRALQRYETSCRRQEERRGNREDVEQR